MPLFVLCLYSWGSGFSSASQFASALLSLEEDKKNAAPTDPHSRQLSIVVVKYVRQGFLFSSSSLRSVVIAALYLILPRSLRMMC